MFRLCLSAVALAALGACVPSPPPNPEFEMPGVNADGPAARACQSAIASGAGVKTGDVAVFAVEETSSGFAVDAMVSGQTSPWACRTDAAGKVLSARAS